MYYSCTRILHSTSPLPGERSRHLSKSRMGDREAVESACKNTTGQGAELSIKMPIDIETAAKAAMSSWRQHTAQIIVMSYGPWPMVPFCLTFGLSTPTPISRSSARFQMKMYLALGLHFNLLCMAPATCHTYLLYMGHGPTPTTILANSLKTMLDFFALFALFDCPQRLAVLLYFCFVA